MNHMLRNTSTSKSKQKLSVANRFLTFSKMVIEIITDNVYASILTTKPKAKMLPNFMKKKVIVAL